MEKVRVIEALDKNGNPCEFLGEINSLQLEDLDNTSLNKVTTGSGFTSMILKGHLKYVICVPFKSLILNKEKWCEEEGIEVLAVYGEKSGGASGEQIKSFKGDKILVTWNSISRLVNALGSEVSNYRLAIDEAHKLTDAGAFRTNAIQDVIDCFKLFKALVLGTATPIADKYMHHEFKGLRKITIKWFNLEPVSVNYSRYSQKDIIKVGSIIGINHLSGFTDGNAHIFMNSVTSIGKIIGLLKTSPKFDIQKIRVIASESDANKEKLKITSGLKVPISSINDEVKKINFYTSTAFEGCDIFDEDGKTYILVDGYQDCTKINITTQLPQVIGRIRNSKTKNKVELIYSPNRYLNNVTKDEFEKELLKIKNEAEFRIKHFEDGLSKTHDLISYTQDFYNYSQTNQFIIERNGQFRFNDLAWYNELHSYETINKIYYVQKVEEEVGGKRQKVIPQGRSVTKEYNSIKYNYNPSPKIDIKGFNKALLSKKVSFSELCEEYIQLKQKGGYDMTGKAEALESYAPLIKKAYEILGPKKMKALKFRKALIDRELLLKDQVSAKEFKIVKLLNLREGEWISSEALKAKLQLIYDSLGLKQKAKSTDVHKYYYCKDLSRRIEGNQTRGVQVIKSKFSSKSPV